VTRLSRALTVLGPVVIVFGFAKLHALAVADVAYDLTSSSRFGWTVAYVVLHLASAYSLGLPDLPRTARSAAVSAASAALLPAFGISVVQLLLGSAVLPRFVVFAAPLVLLPWYGLCTVVADGGRSRGQQRDRVVVVGSWADASRLTVDLETSAERPAQVVDVIATEAAGEGMPRRQPIGEAAEALGATVVVLDREAQLDPRIVEQVTGLHREGVRIRTMSLFYEEWLGKLPLPELEQVALMFDIGEIHRLRYGRTKRLVDMVIAVLGLAALVPVAGLVLVGNRFGNRGPLLYRQVRVGRHGRHFVIYKFRTMHDQAGSAPALWTGEDDPRVTPFGRILRVTHLDELPQVVNILRGDLSVVGPRPEQPHYVAELEAKLPFYESRHLVRPGLTGWAQVKYGYAGDETDSLEKLQYDIYYLRRQSLRLDLRIMVRTLRSVVRREGR
jgi:exopolysaccharide biosynthesis polyprenyl glycosylphosphotransferase